jgi:SAM-dependent methyltransferase
MNSPQLHWDAVYREKPVDQTSWSRGHLDESLRLIDSLAVAPDAPVIDVGGGRSSLVDDLLSRGYSDVTVLDIAGPALDAARARLGSDALRVHWQVTDIVAAKLPPAHFNLWHDRAMFHFLVDTALRQRYVAQVAQSVRSGGYAIIATFAADGPERCSALPVCRYDVDALAAQFCADFDCVDGARELHVTPWGAAQPFTYAVLRRTNSKSP